MYRRVSSGPFIAITTAGIVIVMALFTWVMYGMAQRVVTMADVMVELNESFKIMVTTQVSMANDIHGMGINIQGMGTNISEMNTQIALMSTNITEMTTSVGGMTENMTNMNDSMALMSNDMRAMNFNVNRMTNDIGRATYAFSQPMSYMWGNGFPF